MFVQRLSPCMRHMRYFLDFWLERGRKRPLLTSDKRSPWQCGQAGVFGHSCIWPATHIPCATSCLFCIARCCRLCSVSGASKDLYKSIYVFVWQAKVTYSPLLPIQLKVLWNDVVEVRLMLPCSFKVKTVLNSMLSWTRRLPCLVFIHGLSYCTGSMGRNPIIRRECK